MSYDLRKYSVDNELSHFSFSSFTSQVAPEPHAGFRQPSTTGLPTPREVESSTLELDMTDSGPCPVSSPMPEEIK